MSRFLIAVISSAILAMPVLGAELSLDDIPEDKRIIRFDSEFGLVNFFHHLHAELRTSSCETCHHTYEEVGEIRPCHECHKNELSMFDETPTIAKAFHVRCKGCHQYTTQVLFKTAGPVTCGLCHLGVEHLASPETHPR